MRCVEKAMAKTNKQEQALLQNESKMSIWWKRQGNRNVPAYLSKNIEKFENEVLIKVNWVKLNLSGYSLLLLFRWGKKKSLTKHKKF